MISTHSWFLSLHSAVVQRCNPLNPFTLICTPKENHVCAEPGAPVRSHVKLSLPTLAPSVAASSVQLRWMCVDDIRKHSEPWRSSGGTWSRRTDDGGRRDSQGSNIIGRHIGWYKKAHLLHLIGKTKEKIGKKKRKRSDVKIQISINETVHLGSYFLCVFTESGTDAC